MNSIIENLITLWSNVKEKSILDRKFKHSEIITLIKNISSLEKVKLGESVENRDIYCIKYGKGKKKIALWSQMHGDEATATAAFFDILNFFESEDSAISENEKNIRDLILHELDLSFIPMLNPDGAERFVRENALNIDLNRDAIALDSPEARILYSFITSLKPDFSFNMHDQDYLWSVGGSNKVAALSFLAPQFDFEGTVDVSRKRAMNLISELYLKFSPLVDGRVTKYAADFEPRSFGDTISGLNSSTILIESGLWIGDPEKQFLRKMNFVILLYTFYLIATDAIKDDSETYNSIPFNGKILDNLN